MSRAEVSMADSGNANSSSHFQLVTFNHPLNVKLDHSNFLLWRQQALTTITGQRLINYIQDPVVLRKYAANGEINFLLLD